MKICFVTGGTGGHIYPALALADKMKDLILRLKYYLLEMMIHGKGFDSAKWLCV